jgi:3-hydroxyacyl-CoA dehydrogenase
MKLIDRWRDIAVLGANGKMGSGIALLLLQELATDVAIGSVKTPSLMLIDSNSDGFEGLLRYLREHLKKFAEKQIDLLRQWYENRPSLIDNHEMIETFVSEALEHVNCGTKLENCLDAVLIFETISEDIDKKVALLQQANTLLKPDTYFLTNTSSIPIQFLQEKCYLEGRLIGFHFYNPPAVQKLMEIIIPENIEQPLHSIALDIAKRLRKRVVYSHDIAGFIGNGYFIREIQAIMRKVQQFQQYSMSEMELIFAVNRISQEFLLRPMGIFQLIDYVGIELVNNIAQIMGDFLSDGPFTNPLIDRMLKEGIKGGLHPDGSQKDGFFHYEKGKPSAVYDVKKRSYISSDKSEKWRKECDKKIGVLPQEWDSWKALSRDPDKKEKIALYFAHLWHQPTLGSELAQEFLIQSRRIAHYLVDSNVADSIADVNIVLQEGFFHLYTIDEPFMAVEIAGGKGIDFLRN